MTNLIKFNRHKTHKVKIGNQYIGGDAPVLVQSMTDTATKDIDKTVKQIIDLYNAGSKIVRITVNDEDAAKAVPYIREKLEAQNYNIPLAGCFHYNGHKLLTDVPACAEALEKYRINPGNVGFKAKRDKQFEIMIEKAIEYNKPVRIGVNWGSLDQDLFTKMMDDNAKLTNPYDSDNIMREALIMSALNSAEKAENIGLTKDKIILSCKVSKVPELITVYRELKKRSNYALHLGLTEAGMGVKGMVATSSALSILLSEGIGDTIRASITPRPGEARTGEVRLCNEILQSLGLLRFTPEVTSCPGCGRTTSSYFRELAEKIEIFLNEKMPEWRIKYNGVENLNVAVMGCIVNGPGESKHANIGISLPGSGESPVAPVFADGQKIKTLRGDNIAEEFQELVFEYIKENYAVKEYV